MENGSKGGDEIDGSRRSWTGVGGLADGGIESWAEYGGALDDAGECEAGEGGSVPDGGCGGGDGGCGGEGWGHGGFCKEEEEEGYEDGDCHFSLWTRMPGFGMVLKGAEVVSWYDQPFRGGAPSSFLEDTLRRLGFEFLL